MYRQSGKKQGCRLGRRQRRDSPLLPRPRVPPSSWWSYRRWRARPRRQSARDRSLSRQPGMPLEDRLEDGMIDSKAPARGKPSCLISHLHFDADPADARILVPWHVANGKPHLPAETEPALFTTSTSRGRAVGDADDLIALDQLGRHRPPGRRNAVSTRCLGGQSHRAQAISPAA
jgi:hypothetical protein